MRWRIFGIIFLLSSWCRKGSEMSILARECASSSRPKAPALRGQDVPPFRGCKFEKCRLNGDNYFKTSSSLCLLGEIFSSLRTIRRAADDHDFRPIQQTVQACRSQERIQEEVRQLIGSAVRSE